MDATPKISTRTWLTGMVLVALALRLPHLNQSLWFDEACMSKQRIGSLGQLLTTIYVDIHPPLYLLFCYVWNSAFGDSEIALRIPALLAGLASLPLTYLVGRRLVGRSAALVTVALLALSPVHIWYSIEARLYAPMLAGTLLAVALTQHVLDGRAKRLTWVAYGVVLLGCLSLHYYLATYVLLFAVIALLAPRLGFASAPVRRVVMLNGAGLALIGAWVVLKSKLIGFETSQGYLAEFTPRGMYELLFQWAWTGNGLNAGLGGESAGQRQLAWMGFQVFGVFLFARGVHQLWVARPERPEGPTTVLYALAIPVFLLLLPLLGFTSTYIERSTLPALPFFLMIAGLGLTSLRMDWARLSAGAALVLMAIVNLVAANAYDDQWTVYKPHQDWRSVARYLDGELERGAAGRPIFTPMPNSRSLPYYDARIQDAKNLAPSTDRFADSVGSFRRHFGERLGGVLADFASEQIAAFEAEKAELRAQTQLFIFPIGAGDLATVRSRPGTGDGVIYLIHNHWHPPGDTRVAELLREPALKLIDARHYRGVSIYKLVDKRGGLP